MKIQYLNGGLAKFGIQKVTEITYVEGNTHGQNFRDLQLMSMCKGLLMSNSTLGFLAALLSDNLKFCIQPT